MKNFFAFVLFTSICLGVLGCNQAPSIQDTKTPSFSDFADSTTAPTQDRTYESVTGDGCFAYEVSDGAVKITSVLTEACSVSIPNEIDGYPVTVLGNSAFYQKDQCNSVILPDTLQSIESGAFYRCYAITEIWIPSTVIHIAADAFFRVENLQNIYVAEGSEYYCDIDGVLFNAERTELVTFPEGKSLEEYAIPDGVTSIGGCSFGYIPSVKRLIIPTSVTEFPDIPFAAILDSVTIVSYKDSAAEEYAMLWDIMFEECG